MQFGNWAFVYDYKVFIFKRPSKMFIKNRSDNGLIFGCTL
jgi:hypothetical protein